MSEPENTPAPESAIANAAQQAEAQKKRRLSFRTLAHIAAAMQLLTRFRLFQDRYWPDDVYRESIVWFPLIGVLVGTMGSAVDGLTSIIGLPPFVTAPLAVAAMIWMTGALHEGGLANMADGFGGSADRAEKLRIMQDSRIGTFGTVVLVLVLLVKTAAIANLLSSEFVFAGLVVAGAWSRALMPLVAAWLKSVRPEEAAALLDTPSTTRLVIGLVLAVLLAILLLDITTAVLMLGVGGLCALAIGLLALRQIGGYTRDVLSAVIVCAELGALVILVAAQQ